MSDRKWDGSKWKKRPPMPRIDPEKQKKIEAKLEKERLEWEKECREREEREKKRKKSNDATMTVTQVGDVFSIELECPYCGKVGKKQAPTDWLDQTHQLRCKGCKGIFNLQRVNVQIIKKPGSTGSSSVH